MFQRLLLLTNLYSPAQWKNNELKPAPLLGDKSCALKHPDFDSTCINSQWPIFIMGGDETLEKRKAIKQKPKKKAKCSTSMLCLYPNVRGASREYRTYSGVANYQIPAEEGNSTVILESIVVRRTWCVRQRLLWLEEIFGSKKELIEISIRAEGGPQTEPPAGSEPKPEWNLLSHYTKQYLTRKISAGRKMDIITFFYLNPAG